MGQSIVQIRQMGDALRSSGYKSIDCAVAELIDNSIEAAADDVFVIMNEHVDPASGRKVIYEFGVLDNGTGMGINQLACCLGIGFTTKSDRRGMGRFGVGLPQASLHVTPNVEVYSWTEQLEDIDDPVYRVWLDIDKVKTGEQEEIEDPDLQEIPELFRPFLKYRTSKKQYDFTKHGTLVYWKNCDNVKPKTMGPLTERLEFAIGRKFRHLIYEGSHAIKLITIGHEDIAIDVLPNDPLFLMKPNYVLGNLSDPENIDERNNHNCTEPIFELYTDENHPDGKVIVPVDYLDKKTGEKKSSNVIIRFSKVRAEFYDQTAIPSGDPGSKPIGKYTKKLEGISIVRANREIDFGRFDFYDAVNNPYHRWWGCEILFDPVLDEKFGVANNKQQVELHDDKSDALDEKSMWELLYDIVHGQINKMVELNKVLRKGSRTTDNGEEPQRPSETIIQAVESSMDDPEGQAQQVRDSTSEEEKQERARQELIDQGIEDPTEDQVRALLKREVTIQHSRMGRNGPFIDTDFTLGTVIVKINTEHLFYSEFLEKMPEDQWTAYELFIGALARAINKTNRTNAEQNDELLQEWDIRLKAYLKQIRAN